jgi:hypothetical protein
MSRVKVMKKKISASDQEDISELNKMFEQMTGASHADPDVLIPKILGIRVGLVKYFKTLDVVLKFTEFRNKFPDQVSGFDECQKFADTMLTKSGANEEQHVQAKELENMMEMTKLSEADINTEFKNLKENEVVKSVIITTGNLNQHKKCIDNRDELSGRFIISEPDAFTPLAFAPNLDLKLMWLADSIDKRGQNFILSILHHLYKTGLTIYNHVTSPNIDIRKFSQILVNNIAMLRKQIPRCDKAFDVIENSVRMLETNFPTYYKSSMEAENPSIIIENFIIDLSEQSASPMVTVQFKRIIDFLKTKTAGIKDPKITKLFSMLGRQFNQPDEVKPTE